MLRKVVFQKWLRIAVSYKGACSAPYSTLTLPGVYLLRELDLIIELEHLRRRDDKTLLGLIIFNLRQTLVTSTYHTSPDYLLSELPTRGGTVQAVELVVPEGQIAAATSSQLA